MPRAPRGPMPPPAETEPAYGRRPLESDAGRTSGQLLDILIAREDWEGARTYLERLHAQSPAAANPRLIEVLLAQARALGSDESEDAQLELYQRVRGMEADNAEARAGIERISKARAERARRDVPEISLAPSAGGPGSPAPGQADALSPDDAEAPPPSIAAPQIEVRDPGAEAAIRRAREEEQKARAAAGAQLEALASERERLLAEARAASAERDRLDALLQATVAERERLSVDLEIARTSHVGPRPSLYKPRMSRAARRALFVAGGVALAGIGALATVYATRPIGLAVEGAPATLLDRTKSAELHATERFPAWTAPRPARHVAWSSRDPAVATVDAQGVVRPVGTGTTRIEAREGDLTAGVDVTVSLPARIALDPAEITLSPDTPEAAVRATLFDGAGAPWTRQADLAWSSSDPAVAAFADGKARLAGTGEATLTATLGELHARLLVHALDRRTALDHACNAGAEDACVDFARLLEQAGGAAAAERALTLYEKACAAGAMRGCVAAGEQKERGRSSGTPDPKGALAAYRKACDAGHAPGCTRLGRLYETTVRDAGKALTSYRAACDAGDLEGCFRLGTLYEHGEGVARDAAAAAALHRKACDGGTAAACTSLAHMRWNGSGAVAKDEQEALVLFEKACDARNEEACIFLALKYKAGDRVPADPRKAAAFFGKACAAGHKGSCVIAARPAGP